MAKFKKYLLRFIFIPALVYVVLTSALTFLFKDKLVAIVDQQIEKNIDSKVEVGDINLSFLTAFPFAELRIKDLYIEDRWEKTLIKADLLGIRISLFSLIGKGFKIQSVILKNGVSNVVFNKKGEANFEIFKEKSEKAESSSSAFKLKIRKALLKNMQVRYLDQKAKNDIKLAVQSLEAGGDFSTQRFDLSSAASMDVDKLTLEGTSYLNDKAFAYDGAVNIDLENKVYKINRLDFSVDGGSFYTFGELASNENSMDLDLEVGANDGDLGSVLALLPDIGLGDLSSDGSFDFKAIVKGPYSKKEIPTIAVDFGLKDGIIRTGYLDTPLENVNFRSEFLMGHPKKVSRLNVESFYAELDDQPIDFDLKVLDLDNPLINLRADATISGKSISSLIGEGIKSRGMIELDDLKLQGRLSDMRNRRSAHQTKVSGSMVVDDFSIKGNGSKIVLNSGAISLKDNIINVDELKMNGADVDLTCNGSIKNIISYLVDPTRSSNYIGLDFKLKGSSLDIDHLINIFSNPDSEEESVADSSSDNFEFVQKLDGSFASTLREIKYGDLFIEDFKGDLEFDRGKVNVVGAVKAMDGKLDVDGVLNTLAAKPVLTLKVDCEDINTEEMFSQMGDFGQDMITSEHVSGKLHSKVVIILPFNKSGSFDIEDLKLYAGIGIENGELKGIKMLEDFSKIIHLDDLRHIRFVNMENWLEISNGNIYIPTMFIQSNAINLKLSGVQGFDETIDYNFKVNAGQVITEKVKRFDEALNPIAAKEHGFFNLYFNIFGDLKDMDYKASKRIVSEHFEYSEQRKKDVKYALEKAFGPIDLIKEPSQWADLGDFELMEDMEEEVEYIDGF
jgi:hypothetical protein